MRFFRFSVQHELRCKTSPAPQIRHSARADLTFRAAETSLSLEFPCRLRNAFSASQPCLVVMLALPLIAADRLVLRLLNQRRRKKMDD
jgi:hypothetical protein